MNVIIKYNDNDIISYDLSCVEIQNWYCSGNEFVLIAGNTFDFNGSAVRIAIVTYDEDGAESFIDRVMTIGRINIFDRWSLATSAIDDTIDINRIASQVCEQVFGKR